MKTSHRDPRMGEGIECPYCTRRTVIVWVHGHGQCSHCGINIDECCRGECATAPGDDSLTRRSAPSRSH